MKSAPGAAPVSWLKYAVFALLLLGAGACSTTSAPQADEDQLLIDGLKFENQSRSAISAIRLLVTATGEFVSCGHIPPGGSCASGFPGRVLRGNPVEVSWSQSGQIWSTGALRVNVSEAVRAAGVAEVRVVVIAPGSAGIVLVPAAGSAP